MTKQYHLGDILSVTTGFLVAPRGMAGLYDILGYMAGGDGISTIGLLVVSGSCEKSLLRQHPQLVGVDCHNLTGDAMVEARLTELVEIHGEYLPVSPLNPQG